ncbi:heterokaryon incompatibility protein [Colletotrichum graminicola]|uniref:Heterokaryon incompatibility protein n=1 Tax=Colletotrichum graminicola (strain M1.001 / M2 / FGSC 10212) TaxID=645133 RepID=E3QHW2_COLGM|nr:heterokaryon incompatibility protein [Colletotrichum graminicola M1.001]EFQ30450.1 heterokaryon incompatibility protein [Colletotrichum graminicola M1.001]WDK18707.1 heterokaryon incompatibility protein [Colletotrichum graminicola]
MHSIYQHLPQGYIRLLTLQPGDVSAELSCTLQSTPLESAPEYEAVSYAWGSEGFTDSLAVSSSPGPTTSQAVVSITPNVTCLLKSLRRATEPRVLWIDAICINQADISERGVQVQQMRSIYTRALRTVIWLGPATEDGSSDSALEFLKKMAIDKKNCDRGRWINGERVASDTSSETGSGRAALNGVYFDEHEDEDDGVENDADSFDNQSAQGASTTTGDDAELVVGSSRASLKAGAGGAELSNAFISAFAYLRDVVREWVDEIKWKASMNYRYYITLGYWNPLECRRRIQRWDRGMVAWEKNRSVSHIAFGIPVLYENSMYGFFEERYHSDWAAVDQLLGRPWWSRTLVDGKLSDLLWNTWDRDAQDPRDKVFALLGLVRKSEGLLKPDYGKSTRRVFCEAARDIIRTEESLDILLAAGGPRAQCDGGRLPSWVPDWRRKANDARPVLFVNRARLLTLYISGSMDQIVVNGHGYSACGDEKAVAWFGGDLATLHVHAVLIDEVGPVGTPQGPGPVEAGAVIDDAFSVASAAFAEKAASLSSLSWWWEGKQKNKLTDVVERALCAGSPGEKTKSEVIENVAPLRRFFMTKQKQLACLGPSSVQPGDKVFVIAGCNFPMVLREGVPGPNGEPGMFELVGEAYG